VACQGCSLLFAAPDASLTPHHPLVCSQHELYNKGMSAWNSAQFEPCLEHIVPEASRMLWPRALPGVHVQSLPGI